MTGTPPTLTPTSTPVSTCNRTGLNIAAVSNGGRIVGATTNLGDPWDVSYLIDGRSDLGWSGDYLQTTDQRVIVQLANGGLFNVDRVCLNPAATSDFPPENDLRAFEIGLAQELAFGDAGESSFTLLFAPTGTWPAVRAVFHITSSCAEGP